MLLILWNRVSSGLNFKERDWK